jgi:hypothetical protein
MSKRNNNTKWLKLLASIAIDFFSMLPTLALPLGIVAAFGTMGITLLPTVFLFILYTMVMDPLTSIATYALYKSKTLTTVNAIESLLPFIDVIPTATIAWVYTEFFARKR